MGFLDIFSPSSKDNIVDAIANGTDEAMKIEWEYADRKSVV